MQLQCLWATALGTWASALKLEVVGPTWDSACGCSTGGAAWSGWFAEQPERLGARQGAQPPGLGACQGAQLPGLGACQGAQPPLVAGWCAQQGAMVPLLAE